MMDLIAEQIGRSFSLVAFQSCLWFLMVSAVMFVPLELFYRAKPHRGFRKEWGIDFLFFLGQFFVFNGVSVGCLIALSEALSELNISFFRTEIASQPFWIQVLAVVLLCDFSIYWAHRLSHKIDLLWRFHRVHHTARRLDWMAAYREHPLDNIYTRVVENLPALLLGFPLETIAGFVYFRGLWGLFIHSNVNITLGPLAYVIGSPRLHHWHHDVERCSSCNFANLSPLMDLMFGTYYDPGQEPEQYGIPENVNRGYFAQIVEPCLPAVLLRNKKDPVVDPIEKKGR